MILRMLRAAYIRHQMRRNAEDLNWLSSNVTYGQWRIRQCEARQKRLQAQAWALESPRGLVRRART